MADVSITLGVDGKALTSGLNQVRQQVETFGKGTEAAAMKAARAKGMMAGQVAMQAQDIAVQAQMGTNAMQIFAQQGSQVLSIFGPGGAIAGGRVANTALNSQMLKNALADRPELYRQLIDYSGSPLLRGGLLSIGVNQ